jgi:hypothetical protein
MIGQKNIPKGSDLGVAYFNSGHWSGTTDAPVVCAYFADIKKVEVVGAGLQVYTITGTSITPRLYSFEQGDDVTALNGDLLRSLTARTASGVVAERFDPPEKVVPVVQASPMDTTKRGIGIKLALDFASVSAFTGYAWFAVRVFTELDG